MCNGFSIKITGAAYKICVVVQFSNADRNTIQKVSQYGVICVVEYICILCVLYSD